MILETHQLNILCKQLMQFIDFNYGMYMYCNIVFCVSSSIFDQLIMHDNAELQTQNPEQKMNKERKMKIFVSKSSFK